MSLVTRKVESALQRGAVLITWSSLLLDEFFQRVDTALYELQHLVNKVCFCVIH